MSDTLLIDEEDRYARFRLISWWRQERLAASRVLVVGAGALGNEVLKNLALLGVGNIYIIDYDDVEDSNLTRSILYRQTDRGRKKCEVAAERIREINPDCKVQPVVGDVTLDVGLGVFKEMDLVFGCLDNREARLWTNRCCWKVGTPWVDAGIQEISGVVKVFIPPESACYECGMTETDYKLINLKYSCPLLKREDIQAGKVPTAPTISSIAAGLQVQEGLKILHGHDIQGGVAHVFSGETTMFYTTRYTVRDDCLSHDFYPEEIEVLEVSCDAKLSEFWTAAGLAEGDDVPALQLERDLVIRLYDPTSGYEKQVGEPIGRMKYEDAVHPETEEVLQVDSTNHIERGGDFEDKTLRELGIPPYEIVKVSCGNDMKFFALRGDRAEALGPLADAPAEA
jgi:adenylyltransferase/sulfurtransferase